MPRSLKRTGFTLIEVLAAIALGGLTLVTAVSLFLAVTQSWIIATRTANETGSLLTARYLLQTGLDRSGEIFPSESDYGVAPPGGDRRADNQFFFNAAGSIFGLSELGPLRVFLKIEDETLVGILEPLTLAESNGDPALLTVPLASSFSGIHYWFYNPRIDQWEDTDDIDDFGDDLNYLGAELAFLEIRSDTGPSLWLHLPAVQPSDENDDPEPPGSDNPTDTQPAQPSDPLPITIDLPSSQ